MFHLDLDRTGLLATKLIIQSMKDRISGYNCFDEPPSHYKELNDSLCIRLGIQPAKVRQKTNSKKCRTMIIYLHNSFQNVIIESFII